MDYSLRDVWRRPLLYTMTLVVICQLFTHIMVAKGEFVHKNFTESVGDSGSSLGLRGEDTTHDTEEGAEVRCYCNLPRCVTLGYMCKSLLGACFTNNTPAPTHAYTSNHKFHHRWAPMHGCLELLPGERHAECMSKGGVRPPQGVMALTPAPSTPPPHPDPALTCCRQDMCNYRDSDMYIQVKGDGHADMKRQDSELETLWFRAATIAVPIAGGFILIMLVLVATKMLAKENKRQRMAQQMLGEHYLKAALYPGGGSAALTHSSICCHSPLTKAAPMTDTSLRHTYEEKYTGYRHPGHIYNIEETKPLNVVCQYDRWDQREAESPPVS
ncbi:BMP and activin membrane-bound inhibitor [Chionoecetes opilio]|uniref:BMP and activin membrane-bound inhibitor n=1 Tax=Chionoecetes opilio TaxID=41210 RepID=A0A8J5CY33_CHIOP|nr:BMP and activin membrane-bound inhibitor [Chionoecetes opilio]